MNITWTTLVTNLKLWTCSTQTQYLRQKDVESREVMLVIVCLINILTLSSISQNKFHHIPIFNLESSRNFGILSKYK